jgi:hypothetical protein
MYNSQINNSFNKIKTIWNIIKAEMNRVQGTTNIILKTLLMILELTLTKVLILLKTQIITCLIYFTRPFLA